jgi:hypothetical protein
VVRQIGRTDRRAGAEQAADHEVVIPLRGDQGSDQRATGGAADQRQRIGAIADEGRLVGDHLACAQEQQPGAQCAAARRRQCRQACHAAHAAERAEREDSGEGLVRHWNHCRFVR